MTFNELRYLVAIAQEKSFGRAAQRCFVSQPALSVAIQKLEEELGTQLFERGKSEITVTPVGERIVEQAQRVLEEVARVRPVTIAITTQAPASATCDRDRPVRPQRTVASIGQRCAGRAAPLAAPPHWP